MIRTTARTRWSLAAVAASLALLLTAAAHSAAPNPPRGSDAPPIVLSDLNGMPVDTAKLAGNTLVLVFGELYHKRARQACAEVMEIVDDPRFARDAVVPILIIAQDAPPKELREEAADGKFPSIILRDPKRDAFGAYRVVVVPTVVVVDGHGKVVHALPGFLPRFKDILTGAILLSTGKVSPEDFDRVLDPDGVPSPSKETLKAGRLVDLGEQLMRRGMADMAEERFNEALTVVPGHADALLGLGDLMLTQSRLDDAEARFRAVLASTPDSTEATLGVAAVQILRAGDGLALAEATVRQVLAANPRQPRAHYLMGLVQERHGDAPAAAASFKKSAELLLERCGRK